MMSGIRGKNTKIEVVFRKALFARGFRYRIHVPNLPGKPDMVLPKFQAIIFVHGCFWHAHDCDLFRIPGSNLEFWKKKLEKNQINDAKAQKSLLDLGWRVLTIWECSIRGRNQLGKDTIINLAEKWLFSKKKVGNIRGKLA